MPPYTASPSLINSIIQSESAGNPRAVSPTGARGLMQVQPTTARSPGFGVEPFGGGNLFDPEANKQFGTQYFNAMLNRYGGDQEAALVAYNAGPGNADKWVSADKDWSVLPKPEETQPYVTSTLGRLDGENDMANGNRRRPSVYQPQNRGQQPWVTPDQSQGGRQTGASPLPTAPAPSQDGQGLDLPGQPSNNRLAMARAMMEQGQRSAGQTRGSPLAILGSIAQSGAGQYLSDQYDEKGQDHSRALAEALAGAEGRGDLVNTMLQSGDEGLRNAAVTSMLERPKDSRTKEVKNYEYYRRQAASRGEKPMSFPEWRQQGDTGDLTTDQKNYRFYVRQTRAQGEKPKSFTDWQAETEESKASARSRGKATGEEQANQPKTVAKAERMLGSIDAALRDPALEYVTGPFESWLPNIGANAQRAQSRLDQISGQTFLQGYQDLKGGGAITEIEGSKAEDALARINTQGMSDEDYRQALTDLREVVVKGLQRARGQEVEGDDLPTPSTPEEAAQLPSGTRFRAPDGRIKVTP